MLSEPHWLLLLIPLLWLAYIFKPESRKIFYLRILLIIVICMALSNPVIKIAGQEGMVVVVGDRSASMPSDGDKRIAETVELLRANMPANSRIGLVTFADKAKIEFSPTKNDISALSMFSHSDASNLSDGIDLALSMIPEEMSGRLIIVSDGLWNGNDPSASAQIAMNRGVPIDYRYTGRDKSNDLSVSYLKVPPMLEPKETFILKTGISSPVAQSVKIELTDGRKTLLTADKLLKPGLNEFCLSLVAPSSSVIKYVLKVTGSTEDCIPENNTAQAISMVKGKKPVLVIANSKSSVMKNLLDSNNIESVEMFPSEFAWTIDYLAGFSAIVLDNVSADSIGFSGLHNLASWVKYMGGGLFISGGKNSYGTGGYYQSPLEEALPVSMELRSECRKMSIALAVVLDRSGSMSAVVNGRTKMELADLAAASSLDLLAPMDEFALFAVDTTPHLIIPLSSVDSKKDWYDKILTVKSQGGGIYVYDGIKGAVDVLKKAQARTRHIILFADACDSEKPGNYWELLEDAGNNGISLSVIGLGKESDCDGNLLKKIADCGKGRCFFTNEAEELPRLFSQDTFMAVKSTFIEEPVNIISTPITKDFTGYNDGIKSSLNAYNICYPKSGASNLVVTDTEDKAPILSVWQQGLGRVACFTGVFDRRLGLDFIKTEASTEVLCGVINWLAFDDRESFEQMTVSQSVKNGIWSASINLDPERLRDPFVDTPIFEILCSDNKGEPRQFALKAVWENADKLSVSYPVRGREIISALLRMDKQKNLRLAPASQIYSPEYLFQVGRNGEDELKKISKMTLGKEIIDLNPVWDSMPSVYQDRDISNYLFALGLLVFLLEIAERRTAILTVIFAQLKKVKLTKAIKTDKSEGYENITESGKTLKTAVPAVEVENKATEAQKTEETITSNNMFSALKTARAKANRRTGQD